MAARRLTDGDLAGRLNRRRAERVQQMNKSKLQLSCRAGLKRVPTTSGLVPTGDGGSSLHVSSAQIPRYGVCVSAIPPTLKVPMQHFAGLAKAYYYTAQQVLEACLYVLYTQMHGRPPSY